MKLPERSRGNALRRTLRLLQDLMRGKAHDRHSAAASVGIKPAAADRRLKEMADLIPGICSRIGSRRRREYFFDAARIGAQRPTKQAVVAACFGASLGSLLEGTYKGGMRQALTHLLNNRGVKYSDLERKFWFIRRGGEESLPDKEAVLDELIDAVLEQNVTEIEYEKFDGTIKEYKVRPLSAVIHDHQLYFGAWTESGVIRFFRFSRIRSAERTEETFNYPAKTSYDLEQVLRDSFGIFVGDDYPVEDVRIKLSARWAHFARHHRWHPSQFTENGADAAVTQGGVVLCLRARICPELEQWVLSFGEEAQVLKPETLQMKIADRTRRAAAAYGPRDAWGSPGKSPLTPGSTPAPSRSRGG